MNVKYSEAIRSFTLRKLTCFYEPFARNSCLQFLFTANAAARISKSYKVLRKREFELMKRGKWPITFKLIPQRGRAGLSSEFLYRVKFSCTLRVRITGENVTKISSQVAYVTIIVFALCFRYYFA